MTLANSRKIVLFSSAAALFILLFGLIVGTGSGPARAEAITPSPQRAPDDKGPIWDDGCIVLLNRVLESPLDKCVYGAPDSEKKVVLFGDSHAMQYGPALIRLAREKGWRLTALVRQRCAVAQVQLNPHCDRWRANSMRHIVRREKPDLVVISTATTAIYSLKKGSKRLSRDESQPLLIEGLKKTMRRLQRAGARVVLIRDQHQTPVDFLECVGRHRKNPNARCSFKPDNGRDRRGFDYRAARQVKGVRLIDPAPLFCPGSRCPVVRGNILIYRDNYHITATYSRSIAPWLAKRLPNL